MSANNWAVCPRCRIKAEVKHQAAIAKAEESYGKVSREKYAALVEAAAEPVTLTSSLLEDYELWMTDGGTFSIVYHCSCKTCDFEFSYKHEEQVL